MFFLVISEISEKIKCDYPSISHGDILISINDKIVLHDNFEEVLSYIYSLR